jgi:transposase
MPPPPRPPLLVPLSDEQAVAVYLHYRSYTVAAAALCISRSALYRRVKRWRKDHLSRLPPYVQLVPQRPPH